MMKVLFGALIVVCLLEGFVISGQYRILEDYRPEIEFGAGVLACVNNGGTYQSQLNDETARKILVVCYRNVDDDNKAPIEEVDEGTSL